MAYTLVPHASPAALLDAAGRFLEGDGDAGRAAVRASVHGLACMRAAATADAPATRAWSLHDAHGAVVGAALWTAGHPLYVTDLPAAAAPVLLAGLARHTATAAGPAITAVGGPSDALAALDVARRAAHEPPLVPRHALLLYRCERVTRDVDAPGRLRHARADDLALVLDWTQAFLVETGMGPPDAPRPSESPHLSEGRLHLWEHGGRPVACAAWTRATPATAAVALVYVPPADRGRHFAAAVTVGVTRLLLEQHAKRFTTLFTTAGNPVSNHLYATLGYERVAAFGEVELTS